MWNFDFQLESGVFADWFSAVEAINNAEHLIWTDIDKKSRKRIIDFGPSLRSLKLLGGQEFKKN